MEKQSKLFSAMDITKWFMWKYSILDMGEPLTLIKLLKLLYYAEGVSLAENNQQLFIEDIVAWEQGPAVEVVFDKYWSNPYDLPMKDTDIEGYQDIVEKINRDEKVKRVLEDTFNVFIVYSAWGLRNKTIGEKPWVEATDNGKRLKGVISRKTMKDYFLENYIE